MHIDFCFVVASYQKTESVVKTAAEKTTSILGGFGMGFTSKMGQLKNSESFRSFEEKMGTAYENVKVGEIYHQLSDTALGIWPNCVKGNIEFSKVCDYSNKAQYCQC
jgi:Tumour protein D52 family